MSTMEERELPFCIIIGRGGDGDTFSLRKVATDSTGWWLVGIDMARFPPFKAVSTLKAKTPVTILPEVVQKTHGSRSMVDVTVALPHRAVDACYH